MIVEPSTRSVVQGGIPRLAAALALVLGVSGCAASAAITREPAAAAVPKAAAAPVATEPLAAESAGDDRVVPRIELALSKPLEGVATMEEALTKVKSALGERGFSVVTEIDMQATMKKKLGIDRRPFWILGACNAQKANQAIEADPTMGLLLPCKVIVYQTAEGGFVVAFGRPKAMFSLMGRADLEPLADEVETGLRGAFESL